MKVQLILLLSTAILISSSQEVQEEPAWLDSMETILDSDAYAVLRYVVHNGVEDLHSVVEKVGDSVIEGLDVVNLLGDFYELFKTRNVAMTLGKLEVVIFRAFQHAIPALEQVPVCVD